MTLLFMLITGGKASEIPDSHLPTTQALIIEVKHLRSLQTETIKEQDEVLRALKERQGTSQQLKLHLKQNLTHSDNLEGQLQTLQLERAVLQSDTFHICERPLYSLLKWSLESNICFLLQLHPIFICQGKVVGDVCLDGFCLTHLATSIRKRHPLSWRTGGTAWQTVWAGGPIWQW